MPETTTPAQTPVERALAEACRFARWHGVETPITPRDFGVQRSPAGLTHATFVDASNVVVALIDAHGRATFGLADLDWLHFPDQDNGSGPCHEECDHRRPTTDVELPEPTDGTGD